MHQQERETFYNFKCTSIKAKISPLLSEVYIEMSLLSEVYIEMSLFVGYLHLLKVLVPSQESRKQQILIKFLLSFIIVTMYLHKGIVNVTSI